MFAIGEDNNGNMIVKITSNIGKTDEEIIILDEEQHSFFQKLSEGVAKMMKACACQCPFMQGLIKEYQNVEKKFIECSNTSQCYCEMTLTDMAEIIELGTIEIHEERRMVNTYQSEPCIKIKNQIRQNTQAKGALKYKRYELRVYRS